MNVGAIGVWTASTTKWVRDGNPLLIDGIPLVCEAYDWGALALVFSAGRVLDVCCN